VSRLDAGLVRHALLVVGGRRWWLLPILPLAWLVFQAAVLLLGRAGSAMEPASAQGVLIGVPLVLLGAFLGLRIIAGEIDGRSLEIAYTVPGGCERVWWEKLAASVLILVAGEALLAAATFLFFTPFPLDALYGALQAALFYLVLAMGLATLFRSEAAGAMAVAAVLGLNGLITGFGANPIRASPFWNPHALPDADATELLAWTLQNRIGIVLAMAPRLRRVAARYHPATRTDDDLRDAVQRPRPLRRRRLVGAEPPAEPDGGEAWRLLVARRGASGAEHSQGQCLRCVLVHGELHITQSSPKKYCLAFWSL
jgi:hypothetical protein